MSLVTNWGYTLTEADALTDFLTDEEFDAFTAGKYDGDARIAPNISSVSQAVRNYCGWHLYPSLACEMRAALIDKRVTVVGPDLLIQLPAKFVTAVESVKIMIPIGIAVSSAVKGTRICGVPVANGRAA